MNLKAIWNSILGTAVPAILAWGKTEAERALVAIKRSATGAQIVNLVQDVEQPGKSGPDKMAAVLADAMPLVLTLVTKGGQQAVLADVETLTRSVVESVVADLKATPIATAVLSSLGVK